MRLLLIVCFGKHRVSVVILAAAWVGAFEAHATNYYSDYGASRNHTVVIAPGSHKFEVDGIARNRLTQWFVNGNWQGAGSDDRSGFFAVDPDFNWSFDIGAVVEIKANVLNGGNFEESHVWQVQVPQPNRAPTRPGLISPSEVAASGARFRWVASSDPDGDPIQYEVEYSKDNTFGWTSAGNTSGTELTLRGLVADTGYVVRVRAFDGRGGVSDWFRNSSDPTFRTLPEMEIVRARWILPGEIDGGGREVRRGQTAILRAEVNGFSDGDEFAFVIYEVDTNPLSDDRLLTPQPLIGRVARREGRQIVEARWAAVWQDDGFASDDPEYRFEVSRGNFSESSGRFGDDVLTVKCQTAWHALGRLGDQTATPTSARWATEFSESDLPPGARLAQWAVLWDDADFGAYADGELSMTVFAPGVERSKAMVVGAGNRHGVVVLDSTDFPETQPALPGDWGVVVEGLKASKGNITLRKLEIFATYYLPAFATFHDLEGPTTGRDEVMVLVAGWNPDGLSLDQHYGPAWTPLRNRLLQAAERSGRWDVVRYDWTEDASTGSINFADTPANAIASRDASVAHGLHLGQQLATRYPALKKVHLIASSAGNWAARGAAKFLRQRLPGVTVQVTSLDAFLPHSEGSADGLDLLLQLGIPDTRRIFGEMGRSPWRPARLDAYNVFDGAGSSTKTDLFFGFTSVDLAPYGWDASALLDAGDEGQASENAPGYDGATMNEHSGPLLWYRETVDRQLAGDTAGFPGLGFPGSLLAAEPVPRIRSVVPGRAQPPADGVVFSGEATGAVTAWEWSSSLDGPFSIEPNPSLPAMGFTVGDHQVSLRVLGNDGLWSRPVSAPLSVLNALPTATVEGAPSEVEPGTPVSLQLEGMDHDENSASGVAGQLTLPDGQVVNLTPPLRYVIQAPLTPGTYALSWAVEDDEGTWSSPSRVTFDVRSVPDPVLRFEAGSSKFDASGSFVLQLIGPPKTAVEVRASRSLLEWTVLGRVTLDEHGTGTLTDAEASGQDRRFYQFSIP